MWKFVGTKQLIDLFGGMFSIIHPTVQTLLQATSTFSGTYLKNNLDGKHFDNDDQVKPVVKTWLSKQVISF